MARTVTGAGYDEEITYSYCFGGLGNQIFGEFPANPGRTKPIRDHHREALVSLLKSKPSLDAFEAPSQRKTTLKSQPEKQKKHRHETFRPTQVIYDCSVKSKRLTFRPSTITDQK